MRAGWLAALLLIAPMTARADRGGEPAAAAAPSGPSAPSGSTETAAAESVALPPPPSKKDEYLAAKAAAAGKPRRARMLTYPGKKPEPVVSVFNTWTHEWLVVDKDVKRPLPPAPLVDRFLRCHFTGQATDMRDKLVETLRDAARHFDARRIDIISGYRSPKYNLMLRKKGHEVASESHHTKGQAVDFRIPGVEVLDLERWARDRRAGGVGLYLESKFIHVDVGPVRRWGGT